MKNQDNAYELGDIDDIYGQLIGTGREIMRAVQFSLQPVGEIIAPLREWVVEATDHIFLLMPPECPERDELSGIRSTYEECQHILPGSAIRDIREVRENLSIAHSCMVAGMSATTGDIPPKVLADIAYDRLQGFRNTVAEDVIEKLKGKGDGNGHYRR